MPIRLSTGSEIRFAAESQIALLGQMPFHGCEFLFSFIFEYLRIQEASGAIFPKVMEDLAIPQRLTIARELADLLGALSHPQRICIVEELKAKELDVNSLQQKLGISHSGVSQHLSVLRLHRLVRERREGRRVIYTLADQRLAAWLLSGLAFLEQDLGRAEEMRFAVETVRALWSESEA